MKIQISLKRALTTALVLGVTVCSAYAKKKWDAPPVVTEYCSGCHGVDGNTQLPYFPKLSGLSAQYAQRKLTEFKELPSPPVDEMFAWVKKLSEKKQEPSRATNVERINMEGVAHAASDDAMKEAVLWYQKQTPAAGHGGNTALTDWGRQLFLKGVPAQKVLPCVTCHGQDAQGKGLAPRLAGQNAEYMESQLIKFNRATAATRPK